MTKVMALFICPHAHETALLNFVNTLKQPKQSVLTKASAAQLISGYLAHNHPESNSEETVNNFIFMMESIHFALSLSVDSVDSSIYHISGELLLFPSLRPTGTFKWTHLNEADRKRIRTIGRRIKWTQPMSLSLWFCRVQVMRMSNELNSCCLSVFFR